MKYRVVFAPSFVMDVRNQLAFMTDQAVAAVVVQKWFGSLYRLLDALEEMPKRYPVDRIQTVLVGRETRKIVFGDYLVFYQVDESRRQVDLVTFIHGARRREAN